MKKAAKKTTKKKTVRKRSVPEIGAEILPRKVPRNGFRTHGQTRKPWEPTAEQWAMYEASTRGVSLRTIGAEFGCTHQSVHNTVTKIDEMLAIEYAAQVRSQRANMTQRLEYLYRQALDGWERSKEVETITTKEDRSGEHGYTSTKTVTKQLVGNPAFLGEARAALQDIRKIWAVDKNPKVLEVDTEDEDRVAGRPRDEVIAEEITRLQTTLTVMRSVRMD